MAKQNIERNPLDYILTDLLPLEITELFSLNNFYTFLSTKKNLKIKKILEEIKLAKSNNKNLLFNGGWATTPLKFNILKGNDSQREMSIMQPFSMLNIYLFLECYQKEILLLLKENSFFSLRCHKKSNSLIYKKRQKKYIEYLNVLNQKMDKSVIQQTGQFFNIGRYNSVVSFTGSREWQNLNFKYSHFARVDYKSCFDSIYTHTYKWIVQKNVVDSKEAKNTNLYSVIDRILQNINGYSSNGVMVGPEFSRMIVEILLQQIDKEIYICLLEKGLNKDIDYNIFRYVDDIFIFSNSEKEIDSIIQTISDISGTYMLKLNDLKVLKTKTPFILTSWLSETRKLADSISSIFYTNKEIHEKQTNFIQEIYLIKDTHMRIERMEDDFNSIICRNPQHKRTIVSFLLSALLNNVSRKKNDIKLLKNNSIRRAFLLLEFSFYMYSLSPCFEHTQRIISLISYFDDELHFRKNKENHTKLQILIHEYSFIFIKNNLADLCNLFIILYQYKLHLKTSIEDQIFTDLKKLDNPLLFGNYILYSKHNKKYNESIMNQIFKIIEEKLNHFSEKDVMIQNDFWYIIIFYNLPSLPSTIKDKMKNLLDGLRIQKADLLPSEEIKNIICDFFDSNGNDLFFNWDINRSTISAQITFRTLQRTLFKPFPKKNLQILFGSID